MNAFSPEYFEIASIVSPPALNERPSSASSQLLLSKSKHGLTLLLITYYNMYGFSHYYTLLSQHSPGQGDKETYLAAALALNATFYDVKTPVFTPGFAPEGPGAESLEAFAGAGCVQHDPRDDADPFFTDARPAFVHAQTYKLNAATLPDRWFNEINGRLFGKEEDMLERFNGRDIEKEVWKAMIWSACDIGNYFKEFKGKEVEICQHVRWINHTLFSSTPYMIEQQATP